MTAFYDKTGLPKSLVWGFIGVLIFMMGDGIEQTWLSKYIAEQGLDHEVLFSVYGISVALSAWFSGVIAETVGVRRTMLLGYVTYLIGMGRLCRYRYDGIELSGFARHLCDQGVGLSAFRVYVYRLDRLSCR